MIVVLALVAAVTSPTATAGSKTSSCKPSAGFEQWQFWWENNKGGVLERAPIDRNDSIRLTTHCFGSRPRLTHLRLPTTEQVEQEIVPALRGALSDEDPEVVALAVFALARVAREEVTPVVLDDLVTALGRPDPLVHQFAILGLGVLGHEAAAPVLLDIVRDTPAERARLRSTEAIPGLQRAFAAFSLGLIRDPAAIDDLIDVIRTEPSSAVDLRSAALLALGQIGARSTRRWNVGYAEDGNYRTVVPALYELLDVD